MSLVIFYSKSEKVCSVHRVWKEGSHLCKQRKMQGNVYKRNYSTSVGTLCLQVVSIKTSYYADKTLPVLTN